MNISVTVRLGLNQTTGLAKCEFGRIIDQSRDVLLLHDVNLISVHAEEVVSFEQGHRPVVGVVRDHDSKRHEEIFAQGSIQLSCPLFAGEGVLGVELEIRVIGLNRAHWQADLDAREAEAFSKTAGDQHEAELGELVETKLLHGIEVGFLGLEVDTVWDLGSEGIERVHVALAGLEEALGSLAVVLEPARRHLLELDDLLSQAGLGIAGAAVEIGEEVRLLGLLEECSCLCEAILCFNHNLKVCGDVTSNLSI